MRRARKHIAWALDAPRCYCFGLVMFVGMRGPQQLPCGCCGPLFGLRRNPIPLVPLDQCFLPCPTWPRISAFSFLSQPAREWAFLWISSQTSWRRLIVMPSLPAYLSARVTRMTRLPSLFVIVRVFTTASLRWMLCSSFCSW